MNLNYKASRVADMKRVANGGTRRDQRFTHRRPVLGSALAVTTLIRNESALTVGLDGEVRRASVEALNQTLAAD